MFVMQCAQNHIRSSLLPICEEAGLHNGMYSGLEQRGSKEGGLQGGSAGD